MFSPALKKVCTSFWGRILGEENTKKKYHYTTASSLQYPPGIQTRWLWETDYQDKQTFGLTQ